MLSAQSINDATNQNDDNQMTIFGHKPAVQYTPHRKSCGNRNGENRQNLDKQLQTKNDPRRSRLENYEIDMVSPYYLVLRAGTMVEIACL